MSKPEVIATMTTEQLAQQWYAMREENKALRAALAAMVDDERCSLDHEGFCQTHSLGRPCEVAAARELLARN